MKRRYVYLVLNLMIMNIVFGCNAADVINKVKIDDSVTKSIQYVHDAFQQNYWGNPILEAGNNEPVGSVTFEGPKVFINFRGSLGAEFLPLLTKITLTDARQLGIEGKVHSGALTSALNFKAPILEKLNTYCSTNGFTMGEIQVYLGGYSRGSTFATALAPLLRLETDVQTIQCITYGTLNVFDSTAASSYENFMGKDSYSGFVAQEDLSRSFFTSFSPVGNMTIFSANDHSSSYKKRVQDNKYSRLNPAYHLMISMLIPIAKWEAHMPETYLEAIPSLYAKTKMNG